MIGSSTSIQVKAMLYEFNGYRPVVHPSAYIHPQAVVTGNVIIGRDVYIGPGAALRGDWGEIVISDGCNVQESCTVHMFPGVTVRLEENAHIGHGAIIHGAHVGRDCLVGMNAVLMDEVVVGVSAALRCCSWTPQRPGGRRARDGVKGSASRIRGRRGDGEGSCSIACPDPRSNLVRDESEMESDEVRGARPPSRAPRCRRRGARARACAR